MIRDALAEALPVLRALGEPTRAQIVGVMIEHGGTRTVGDIQAELGLPQSTVSRHLRILLDGGLVDVEQLGTQRAYRLAVTSEHLDALEALTRSVRACREDSNDAPLTLGAINMAADDPGQLSSFWAKVTGGQVSTGDGFAYLAPARPDGFGMFFRQRESPHENSSDESDQHAHLDLTVGWGHRETEVARLIALGAEHRWDVLDEHPHVRWTTLADPEGNLFCVAEHPPAQ